MNINTVCVYVSYLLLPYVSVASLIPLVDFVKSPEVCTCQNVVVLETEQHDFVRGTNWAFIFLQI